jgi:hypothetical protein
VICGPAPVKRRDAPHRVDDVLVEAREEPKSMLARHAVVDRARGALGELVSARVLAFLHYGDAPGLPSGEAVALEHNDTEAALDQFVRSAHPGDAPA